MPGPTLEAQISECGADRGDASMGLVPGPARIAATRIATIAPPAVLEPITCVPHYEYSCGVQGDVAHDGILNDKGVPRPDRLACRWIMQQDCDQFSP